MKRTLFSNFLTLLIVFSMLHLLPNTFAQDNTQWGLPEGARTRLGRGRTGEIRYSPDGTRLAVGSGIGIWLYDTATYQEISLLTGQSEEIFNIAFSPDGKTIASGCYDGTICLWNIGTGTYKTRLTTCQGPRAKASGLVQSAYRASTSQVKPLTTVIYRSILVW